MEYNISEILKIIGSGNRSLIGDGNLKISRLLTDSRSLTYPSETLFFALTTQSGDGHRYLRQLYDKGVKSFVVSAVPDDMKSLEDANFIVTDNPLVALHALAGYHRNRFDVPVIAITGSRGKTIVKEWLNSLLQDDIVITRSPRSYNSQIGVPLSVWELNERTQLAIFEAGISMPGEMARLKDIIRPEIGIFTNIGTAHSSGFLSIEDKCREKASLLSDCRCVIYNSDDELISRCMPDVPVKLGWSRIDSTSPLFVEKVESGGGMSRLTFSYLGGEQQTVEIPFANEHDIENAIHCLATMLYLAIPADVISERMSRLTPVGTRLEVIEGVNGCLLIHDSYTSDFNSLSPALDFMRRRAVADRSLTAVISDLSCGEGATDEDYARMAELLAMAGISRLIGVGPELKRHAGCFNLEKEFFDTTEEFLEKMSVRDFNRELILVKGAPRFWFARICELLEARQHETVLEINLDAVVDNFNAFRSRIRPTTGIACMIKASGYGAGSHELARTLQAQGATYLAVAVHDEGAELRRAGITMPILVLNPTVENFHAIFTDRLEPEIYSFDFLEALIREAGHYGVKNFPIHIKIDSGMHRLGFLKEDLPRLIDMLKSTDCVTPRSIFSHLCAADDPMEDDYTKSQFEYFDECCRIVLSAFPGQKILRHILNSTGITRFPDHQLDMVRLGIGLYGIKTLHDGSQDDLRPVSSLHTVILSLKHWPAGTTIGYNRRGVLKRDSVIATVPVGYADGINRHLGYGNACMVVRGVKCPTVGTICMDACMIDVTDVEHVSVGDRVEVFGESIPVDTLAETLGTIPYEVLTSVSSRVKRVYYRE
ncbi:bifunctional UDP-N-acetylmuramoyl-tripeptide:D-alanyl-D-alanine ligase/alanine racemase [uncultured Duncaniella sp.]|uniref:bifunctional UDP-N-acetylmuramoyl-tripeptide:D-alanyl-D-alanine ligase/alanine racemase n=1 Tax=uncultured Duncaniella sp. TaxID=2768039 RepID=UPI0025A936D5|nr:bifunctional UDP-N-acetylmuramoyl-tripeptide:D-alanyl-D-alanine ligase/alanine racemase [uncultured Duncaniella sp.]